MEAAARLVLDSCGGSSKDAARRFLPWAALDSVALRQRIAQRLCE
jgi:hypothetical protein